MSSVAGPFLVPATLDWLNATDDGRRWLADLPSLTGEALARFNVRQDGPLLAGMVSLVVPAVTAAGRPVVAKVRFPHPEAAHEAAALRAWASTGAAVGLLDEDADLDTLLLERLDPGTPISMLAPDTADRVVAGLVDRAAVPAPPGAFPSLAGWADDWADDLAARAAALHLTGGDAAAAAARLADRAALAAARLARTQQGPAVIANEDLHPDNVLLGGGGWRLIDPKPVAAERAFAAARWVWDWAWDDTGEPTRPWRATKGPQFDPAERVATIARLLDVDEGRLAGWAFVSAARAAVWWPGPAGVVAPGWEPSSALTAAARLAVEAAAASSGGDQFDVGFGGGDGAERT